MSEWDSYAADWDDDPGAQAYAVAAFTSLQAVLAGADVELAGANVLDFGCGTGLLTERLIEHGALVTAVDNSTAMLAVLQDKIADRNWSGVQVTPELPTAPASFELIVCSSVCAFLDDYPNTANALAQLLAPAGVFVQWDWERNDADDEPFGLTRTEISDALHAAGLEQVTVDVGFEIPFEDQVMAPLMGTAIR